MIYLLFLLLFVHGLIHLLGFVKAFHLAELPQLGQPIAPVLGLGWLLAAVLFVAAAASVLVWPRWWWAFGSAAIIVSTVVILPSWADAKVGALANVILTLAVVGGFLWYGPFGLRAAYDEDVSTGLAGKTTVPLVTDADLDALPEPVRRYLRVVGVVGQPRVRNMRVRMHGRIRGGATDPWMPFSAEQHNIFDRRARFFYMTASRAGLPIQGYHRYAADDATMHIKALGAVTVVRVAGREMTRAETVTLLNDMCVMAPATLIDSAIVWEPVDTRTARATFSNAGHVIRAELTFSDTGELENFWSDDRGKASTDGTTMTRTRWSTPLGAYRSFGSARLVSRGEARWHEDAGDYAYIEFVIDEIAYNVP